MNREAFGDEELEDQDVEHVAGSGEGLMEDRQSAAGGARRNEDIALDLMKFIAMATSYGKTPTGGVGFTGGGSPAKPEDQAVALLELYSKCVSAVAGKK